MKRIFKQSAFYLLSSIFLKATQFILLPYYTYLISPSELGTIFIILVLIEGLNLLFGLSLKASLLVYSVRIRNLIKSNSFFTSVIMNSIILSLSCIVLLVTLKPFAVEALNITSLTYVYFIGSTFFGFYFPLLISRLQGLEKVKLSVLITFFYGVLSIALVLIGVLNVDNKVEGYLLGYSLSGLVGFLIFFVYSIRNLGRVKKEYMYLSVRFSSKLILTDISAWIVNFSDRVMLFKISGAVSNGLYTTSYRLGMACDIIYFSINKSFTPIIFAEFKKKNPNREKIASLYLFLITFYTLIATLVMICSPLIIYIVDKAYADIVFIIPIIVLAYLFNAYKLVIDKPLSYFEKFTTLKSRIWVCTAIINISLNLLLIPNYSVYGAAVATAVSFAITLIPMFVYSQKAFYIPLKYSKVFAYILLSVMVYLLSLYSLKVSLIFVLLYLIYTISLLFKLYNNLSDKNVH